MFPECIDCSLIPANLYDLILLSKRAEAWPTLVIECDNPETNGCCRNREENSFNLDDKVRSSELVSFMFGLKNSIKPKVSGDEIYKKSPFNLNPNDEKHLDLLLVSLIPAAVCLLRTV